MKLILSVLIVYFSLLIHYPVFSQIDKKFQIPDKYINHSEIGKTSLKNPRQNQSFELIHKRTAHSRIFKNIDGSYTTAYSSNPLHFFNNNSQWWETIDYTLSTTNENSHALSFPKNNTQFLFNTQSFQLTTLFRNEDVVISGKDIKLLQLDSNLNIIISKNAEFLTENLTYNDNSVIISDVFNEIDLSYSFFHNIKKNNYIINNLPLIEAHTAWMAFEEIILVPNGWYFESASETDCKKNFITDVVLKDQRGNQMALIPGPIYSNASISKERDIMSRGDIISGVYDIEKIEVNKYRIRTLICKNWMMSHERIFPITIDPIVIVDDTVNMNSCFYPNFESSSIFIPVPQGEIIFNTYLEWDFVAVDGTSAWIEDQRSYVSSQNGNTMLFSESIPTHGVQTYSTNSGIASGISMGYVDLTFHASRVWGGSGCNAIYNFISNRYVELTHDTVQIGAGQVVINEYSCSNRSMVDDFGNYEDWVELYNSSSNYIDMTGYYLSDNPNNPTKWQFPGGIIPPGGHLLIMCSGRDTMSGNTPHTNFRLSQLKQESIILSDSSGNILEEYVLFITQNGHSYGRIISGDSLWGIFQTPTPGYNNSGHKDNYTEKPLLTPEAGFYSNHITISMSITDSNSVIRYTTDGSNPTISSTIYNSPITINNTTVVKARSFSNNPDIIPGFIESNTYFIDANHTLPVFSFSGGELPILFGGTQINPIGAYEFFNENGVFIDEAVGDFDKHGNDSWSYPQRGVDFVARDEYGYNSALNYKFFATSDRDKFQRLMVKAAANDNYPFETGGAHIRDSYIQTLSQLSHLNLDERSSTNCIVYVNGNYWGIYDLREKVDDVDYTAYYYNQTRKYKGSTEYIQFLKTWGATQAKYGEQQAVQDWASLRNFISNNNMGVAANFAYVDSLLDIESLIDYFVFNSYVVSRDWLNYNTGWWRGLNPTGGAHKWRYILWDMEAALGHFHNYTGIPDVSANALPCNVENINVGNGHAQNLKKLIDENSFVKQKYVSRYIDLLNTYLSCSHAIHVLDSMVLNITPEMPAQIARWGGSMATWQNNVQNVRDFINHRCSILYQGLSTCYQLQGPYNVYIKVEPPHSGIVKMNSVYLPSYPFDAVVFGGIQTNFTAQGLGPYQLSYWEMPMHIVNPSVNSNEIYINFLQNDTITAYFHNPNLVGKELLYYWHFNNMDTLNSDITFIDADYKLLANSQPQMTYQGIGIRDIDFYSTGSSINLQLMEEAGGAARVRNPSIDRALVFNMPTNYYSEILFEYVVHRSPQGMLNNEISYSIDGINFIQTGLSETIFDITEDYSLVSIDFSNISQVNNNPNFHVKINFSDNANQTNGNNRFDNITLKGVLFSQTELPKISNTKTVIFPNPATDYFKVFSNSNILLISIYDVLGKRIYEKNNFSSINEASINVNNFSKGVYFVNVQTSTGISRHKVLVD